MKHICNCLKHISTIVIVTDMHIVILHQLIRICISVNKNMHVSNLLIN